MNKNLQKGPLLYEGKGKKIYKIKGQKGKVILQFKDDLTAYQGRKKGSFKGKGEVCKSISSLIFRHLKKTVCFCPLDSRFKLKRDALLSNRNFPAGGGGQESAGRKYSPALGPKGGKLCLSASLVGILL